MAITWCKSCGGIDWQDGRHNCPPVWEARAEWEGDDDWREFHATDSEEAAEKAAEYYDCNGGEYAIVGRKRRGDDIFLVRKLGTDAIERFAIEAEAVPTYYATLLAAA